jgi:hypothetical protein
MFVFALEYEQMREFRKVLFGERKPLKQRSKKRFDSLRINTAEKFEPICPHFIKDFKKCWSIVRVAIPATTDQTRCEWLNCIWN